MYLVENRTAVENVGDPGSPSRRISSQKRKQREGEEAEMGNGIEQSDSRQDSNAHASPTATSRTVWLFSIDAEHRRDSDSNGDETMASTHGPHSVSLTATDSSTAERKDSPEDDLWGESEPTPPRPDKGGGLAAEQALLEDVEAARAEMKTSMGAVPNPQEDTLQLQDLYDGSLDQSALHLPRSQVGRAYQCLRKAIRQKLSEELILRRARESQSEPRRRPSPSQGEAAGAARGHGQPSSLPSASESVAEEDGEILDSTMAAEPGSESNEGFIRQGAAPPRPLLRLDEGFIFLPRKEPPDAPSPPPLEMMHSHLLFGHFDVYFAPPVAVRPASANAPTKVQHQPPREEPKTSGVLVAQLLVEETDLLPAALKQGSVVTIAPRKQVAEVVQPHLEEQASDNMTLTQLKRAVAERIADEAYMEASELLDGSWCILRDRPADASGVKPSASMEDHLSADTFVWPRRLCLAMDPNSQDLHAAFDDASAYTQRLSKTRLSKLPIIDLLQRTKEMLGHRPADTPVKSERPQVNSKPPKIAEREDGDMESAPMEFSDRPADGPSGDPMNVDSGPVAAPEQHEAEVRPDTSGSDDLFGSDDGSASPEPSVDPIVTVEPAQSGIDEANSVSSARGRDGSDSPNRPGMDEDEGMYGLITEDDFAFFDDVADAREAHDASVPDLSDTMPQEIADMDGLDAAEDVSFEGMSTQTQSVTGPMPAQPTLVHFAAAHQPENAASCTDSAGIATDPSSLPGFTPGSITDSSPATGGLFDRTPRTPTSPYYDVGVLGGRPPMQGHDGWQGADVDHVVVGSSPSQAIDGLARGRMDLDGLSPSDREEDPNGAHKGRSPWDLITKSSQQRRLKDLGDKYTSGKFAVPSTLAPGIAGGGRRTMPSAHAQGKAADADGDIKSGAAHNGGIALGGQGRSGSLTLPLVHKLRISSLAEDELSEPGTLDGTASAFSDEDNGDDSSDDDDNDESYELQRRRQQTAELWVTLLKRSLARVERSAFAAMAAHRGDEKDSRLSLDSAENTDLIEQRDAWAARLLCNPQTLALITSTLPRRKPPALLKPVDCHDVLDSIHGGVAARTTIPSWSEIEALEMPRVLVGCQGNITQFASPALRFWDKLGLSPAGGGRAVTTILLRMSGESAAWFSEASRFLERLQTAFQTLGLGCIDIASEICLELGGEDDVFPGRLAGMQQGLSQAIAGLFGSPESRDETLRSIAQRAVPCLGPDNHVVIYAIGEPMAPFRLSSFLFMERQLRAIVRESSSVGEFADHIHVREVPWASVAGAGWDPDATVSSTSVTRHAFALYESLQISVKPMPLRELHPAWTSPSPTLVSFPTFTLAPVGSGIDKAATGSDLTLVTFRFGNKVPSPSSAASSMLHVAYDLGQQPGDLACLSIIDESGHSAGIIRSRRRSAKLSETLRWIWKSAAEYANAFARRQWRVILCKVQPMGAAEAAAWKDVSAESSLDARCCLDVVLACRDAVTPLFAEMGPYRQRGRGANGQLSGPIATPHQSSSPGDDALLDVAEGHFAMYPTHRLLVPAPPAGEHLGEAGLERSKHDRDADRLLALCSAVLVTTRPGPRSFAVPRQTSGDGDMQPERRSEASPRTSWLHLVHVFPGPARGGHPQGPPTGTCKGSSDTSPPGINPSEVLRQVTRSYHAVRLLTTRSGAAGETLAAGQRPLGNIGAMGAEPWHVDALQKLRPALERFARSRSRGRAAGAVDAAGGTGMAPEYDFELDPASELHRRLSDASGSTEGCSSSSSSAGEDASDTDADITLT